MASRNAALDLFLGRLASRSVLNEAERSAILSLPGHLVDVSTRQDFVRLGEKVDHACLIVSGLCARVGQTRDGNRQIVALHIPGDMADLHSVVTPKVSWALHALTPSTILKIPHAALLELVGGSPAIGVAFWRDTMVDASILAQWMLNYGRKTALANVAHLLCEMYLRYQRIGMVQGQEYRFAITQMHIADVLGLTSVHVNRMMKQLEADGIATKRGDLVSLKDRERLAEVAEFDPIYLQFTAP